MERAKCKNANLASPAQKGNAKIGAIRESLSVKKIYGEVGFTPVFPLKVAPYRAL
jgi:hypothetical protein